MVYRSRLTETILNSDESDGLFISAFFDQVYGDILRAIELIDSSKQKFYTDGILLLCCHIASLAKMRYPNKNDRDGYIAIVLEYSGMGWFYEKVDLKLFYQLPNSILKEKVRNKPLNSSYKLISNATKKQYPEKDMDKPNIRYIHKDHLIKIISSLRIQGVYPENINEYISIFTLSDILYRFIRCYAVHNFDFPLLNRISVAGKDEEIYEANHIIDHEIIIKTAKYIFYKLWSECIAKNKWAHEL